ncbi:hypothetical protein E4U43_007468 [Claviceps pusilla]|uniref:Uncharacterized protein n=1 Tax=Claviceps pusilla TaxID=123648 RepID=A0A9P7T0J2_9HYPO|nr:hypothetical protein E4U43_007468 [Claviceps pusilla]
MASQHGLETGFDPLKPPCMGRSTALSKDTVLSPRDLPPVLNLKQVPAHSADLPVVVGGMTNVEPTLPSTRLWKTHIPILLVFCKVLIDLVVVAASEPSPDNDSGSSRFGLDIGPLDLGIAGQGRNAGLEHQDVAEN